MSFELPNVQSHEKTGRRIFTTEVNGSYVQFEQAPQEKFFSQGEKREYSQEEILNKLFPENNGDESKACRSALHEILQKLDISSMAVANLENSNVRVALLDFTKEYLVLQRIASSQMNTGLGKVIQKVQSLLSPPINK